MIEALYIHIPFCKSRCSYCDFSTTACNDDAVMDAYIDALSLQIRRASKAGLLGNIHTIYIGGGTPTHLGARRLNSLVYLISLSCNLEQVTEFTLEANPESINEAMVKDLYALGVNRVSLGVQSICDETLRFFNRAHNAAQVEDALAAISSRISNYSVDLICGIPGQTMEEWREQLNWAAQCGATHVSVYPLTIEEGTPLYKLEASGQITLPDDDLVADMMLEAQRCLKREGFERYEVASYAKPGCESQHNSAYWSGVSYLGLGAGASSMLTLSEAQQCKEAGMWPDIDLDVDKVARVRLDNEFDIQAYSESLGKPHVNIEFMSEKEAFYEDAMLAMRMVKGEACAIANQDKALSECIEALLQEGLVEQQGDAFVPTEQGWLCGNEVFGAIWDLASQDETPA